MGDMDKEVEKTLKIITFSGKIKHWRMFSKKFMARGKKSKKFFKQVLLGNIQVPSEATTLDPTKDEDKVKKG